MTSENIDDPVTLGKIDLKEVDVREISAIVVEETIDDMAKPDLEGGDIENTVISSEEKIINTVNPRKVELEGSITRKNSTTLAGDFEKIEHRVGDVRDSAVNSEEKIGYIVPPEKITSKVSHLRRNSSTTMGAPITKHKVRSRFLSRSHGSCHDFCKYGCKYDSEEKAKNPLLRSISESHKLTKTSPTGESKNKSILRHFSFPRTGADRHSTLLVEIKDPSANDTNGPKIKHVEFQIKSPSAHPARQMSSTGSSDIKSAKKMGELKSSSQKVKELKIIKNAGSYNKGEQNASVSSMQPLKKAASMNPRFCRNLTGLPHLVNQNCMQEAKLAKPVDVPEKTLYMIEPTGDRKASETSETSMDTNKLPDTPTGYPVNKNKGSRSIQSGVCCAHLSSSPISSSLSKSKLSKMREQGESESLHIKQSDSIPSGDKPKTSSPKGKSVVEQKVKAKRVDASQSADKCSLTWKMKFRTGVVVALPGVSSIPKKLRFKSGRVMSENQTDDVPVMESFKEIEVTGDEPHHTGAGSENVVLRHQEATSKKDSLSLNNVIEETASELVKTRKSKVKALVGAFESVMFL